MKTSVLVRNLSVNSWITLANNGYVKIYSGTQPASPETAISGGNALLATLRLGATAFGTVANGAVAANALTPDNDAAATGIAAWCRVLQSNGSTVLFDGTIGITGSFDLVLDSVSIQQHAYVAATALTVTLPQ